MERNPNKRKSFSTGIKLANILICLIFTLNLSATPADSLLTKTVAKNFYKSRVTNTSNVRSIEPKLAYTGRIQKSDTREFLDCYYIYNVGQGYVIVSADTRIEPVLGYSTEGNFNPENIPVNMKFYLDKYASEIKTIIESDNGTNISEIGTWRDLSVQDYQPSRIGTPVVDVLMASTWNQDDLYNDYCPTDASGPNGHTYAGCVATAMAQVIRYWQYPSHGSGSHSYSANNAQYDPDYGNYGTLTVNFGNATYDYTLMPDYLSYYYSTDAQINEVAKLIYHCGVSVEMSYGPGGSGAYTGDCPYALQHYFNYPPCSYASKYYYTNAEWIALLKNDLDQFRPMIYSGSGNYGGHAFVCDGYDNQNYFHFNWGWSGSYNGYFLVTNLNPGGYTFSDSQGVVYGIQANTPMIINHTSELNFIAPIGGTSEMQSVELNTLSLSQSIQINAIGNFEVSNNGTSFANSTSIPSSGGTFYVKYVPTATTVVQEQGMAILTSGTVSDTIILNGNTYELNCNPPTSLEITQNLDAITLEWETPHTLDNKYNVSWDSTYGFNYGYGEGYEEIMLHRLAVEDLAPYHTKQLTKIKFYAIPGATSYKAVVYVGGHYDSASDTYDPGTRVIYQDVNINNLDYGYNGNGAWNTVTLDEPVQIDASQELWYGMYLATNTDNYLIPFGYGEYIPTKGDVEGFYYNSNIYWWSCGYNVNYSLAATIEDSPATVESYTIDRNDDFTYDIDYPNNSYTDHITNTGLYNYVVTANWSNGCEASVSGDILVNSLMENIVEDMDETICSGETYDFYGNPLTTEGDYSYEYLDNGRNHIINLHLTVLATNPEVLTEGTCDSYTWHGVTYTESGTYTFSHPADNGCTQVDTLHLTIYHPAETTFEIEACNEYQWEGETYTESGDYTRNLITTHGCDSIVTLRLFIHNPTNRSFVENGCDFFIWHDMPYFDSGTYTYEFTDEYGCTEVDTLHLTIRFPEYFYTSVDACESYTWNDNNII